MHDLGEVRFGGLQGQMIMIVHQTIDVHEGPQPLAGIVKDLQEEKAVLIGQVNGLFLVPPGINVIKGSRILDSQLAGHDISDGSDGLPK